MREWRLQSGECLGVGSVDTALGRMPQKMWTLQGTLQGGGKHCREKKCLGGGHENFREKNVSEGMGVETTEGGMLGMHELCRGRNTELGLEITEGGMCVGGV